MSQRTEKRSLKNLKLTEKYHWSYMLTWVVSNSILLGVTEIIFLSATRSGAFQHVALPVSPAILSILIFLGMLLCVQMIGKIWAHRLAGAHLRTEMTLLEASKDFSTRLRYRKSDKLDEVASAFNDMMEALENPDSSSEEQEKPKEKKEDKTGNRRSLKNLEKTSKHHVQYMSIWLALTCGNLLICYLAAILYFFLAMVHGSEVNVNFVIMSLTVALCIAVIGVVWSALMTAHRLAGVHIKLAQTFHRVADGERDVELKFRSYDKLESVEAAFAEFVKAVNNPPFPAEPFELVEAPEEEQESEVADGDNDPDTEAEEQSTAESEPESE